ncbi:hypothetical protein DESC_720205 [Desulfosarcina cetonica]|nr:hypothetical protein DESC_720205 [Desulfosarcina cetonica]
MIYFYIFDHRQHHHHTYWTHIPLYWAIVLVFPFLLLRAEILVPFFMFYGNYEKPVLTYWERYIILFSGD